MAVVDIYVPMSVGFDDDPKVVALGRFGDEAGLCRDLYLAMLRYCKRNLTDGFVPAEEVGRLAWPLAPERAARLVEHLAEVGLAVKADSNLPSTPIANGWQVVSYVKRNGTRADVERLSDVRREAGKLGAQSRWSRARDGKPIASATGRPMANDAQDRDKDKDLTREADWTPHSALGPPPAPKRGGGPRTTHPNVAAVQADAHRPGGPATDEQRAARAAEARRALAAKRGDPAPAPVAAVAEIPGQLALTESGDPPDEYPF